MMIVCALVGGLNLFIAEPSSQPDLAQYGSIDFCAMGPLQNVCNLIIGGVAINCDLLNRFRDLTSDIFETFGMAET